MAVSDDMILRGGGEDEREVIYTSVRLALEQRNLALAADRCGRLLQEYADDETAHALMGDICAARQSWAEAVDWYRLAEELGAGPEVSRRRTAAQAMVRQREEEAALPPTYTDLHRQRTRVLAIFGGAAAVIVVAGIIALLAFSSGSRPTPQAPSPPVGAPFVPAAPTPVPTPVAPGTVATTPPPPAVTTPAAPAARPRVSATRGQPAQPPPIPRAPVVITRLMTVPATDEDYLIAQAVGALTWPHGASMSGNVSVMMDPYQGYGVITFRIPDDLPGDNLADVVVEQAYKVINAALAADAGLTMVTVRAIATITISSRRAQTLQAFRANATRRGITEWAKLIPNPTAKQLREQILGAVWWNPSVPQDHLR